MQLSPEQVERRINSIAWGKRYIVARDSSRGERTLVVGALSLRFKEFMNFRYNVVYEQAIDAGIMSEAEMLRSLAESKVWTKDDDEKISYLRRELASINEQAKDIQMSARASKKLDKIRRSIIAHIDELEDMRTKLLQHTAEKIATEAKIRAYIYATIENENGERLWKTWEEFEDEPDEALVQSITVQIAKRPPDIDVSTMRYIARHPLWRYRWSAAKLTGKLFGKDVMDLTDDQTSLIYWSQLYDSVYDAYERPSKDIIDNDELLDEWLDEQTEKNERAANKRATKKDSISSKVMSHGEVFVASQANMIKTAEGRGWGGGSRAAKGVDPNKVYNMNDPLAKKFLGVQNERLKKAGVIEERDLRSDSDSRRVIGSQDAIVSKRRRRDGFTGKSVDKLLPGGTLKGKRND